MHSSHTLLAGTTAVVARTSQHHRVTASSWTARVAAFVDALIDQAHLKWPTESGVLHLPTGESLFVPHHHATDPACPNDHAGYYQARVRPSCAANPIPQQRGTSELRPLVLDVYSQSVAGGARIARYTLDLRTGDLLVEHDPRSPGA